MIQSIASNASALALRQLSVSPTRSTEQLERLTTGPREIQPTQATAVQTDAAEQSSAPVKTSSINPLDILPREQAPKPVSVNGTGPQPTIEVDRGTGVYSEPSNSAASLQIRQQLGSQPQSMTGNQTQSTLAIFR